MGLHSSGPSLRRRDTLQRYHAARIALHWIVAGAVLGQLALGWWMLDLPKTPPGLRAGWFNLHKSIGLTIGAAMMLRAWLWSRFPSPPLPVAIPRWQAVTARATHVLIYVYLLLLPISGYLGSSFSKYPVKYFGLTLPQWGWDAPPLKEFFGAVHCLTAWTLLMALALHVAAALKHVFVDRDTIVQRIWFSTRGDRS